MHALSVWRMSWASVAGVERINCAISILEGKCRGEVAVCRGSRIRSRWAIFIPFPLILYNTLNFSTTYVYSFRKSLGVKLSMQLVTFALEVLRGPTGPVFRQPLCNRRNPLAGKTRGSICSDALRPQRSPWFTVSGEGVNVSSQWLLLATKTCRLSLMTT